MGRIKKAAGPKHEATLSPALSQFVSTATSLPLARLPSHLHSFPARWPFPRGDLYHWIPLLDHFDKILEDFVTEYCLNEGPQTQFFGTKLLERYGTHEPMGTSADVLEGFGPDGDREVIETILLFSKTLMENCGNRSLYSSSDRLGSLLNTTSLSLLLNTLRLMARLAQRYHASRQRGAKSGQHLNTVLLASHYNVDLDHVQKLADPFVKTGPPIVMGSTTTPATTPGIKGKEKAFYDAEPQKKPRVVVSGSDMFAAVKDETTPENGAEVNGKKPSAGQHRNFDDWGDVWFSYYQGSPSTDDEKKLSITSNGLFTVPSALDSPTPARRTSALSRPSRLSMSDDSSNTPGTNVEFKMDEAPTSGLRTISIPNSVISSTALEKILEANLPDIPKEYHYEFLSRLRVAKALTQSLHTRRQILAIRILAITNLAYIYPDPTFQQKILQQDSDEPRRLQLVYQLAELIHPPGNGKAGIPLDLKTIAVGALEALSKHKNRASDVCTALSVNVNHGVLLYVLRKTVADLATEDDDYNSTEGDEWRDAIFSLLDALPAAAPRTAESLVGAGLFDILIEVLTFRTSKAERTHPKVLMFMNNVVYTVRDALMTFANSKGLDAVSDLISWEVTTSLQLVRAGKGLPEGFRNQVIDYGMPYFQQQTLRWLFKFVNHMMQHGNTNFDRLLRNLIDSPHLLSGLRQVLSNAWVFGSNVWSGAVNILSSFIHNEPTSYAVIAEAGLSKAFLEAITTKEIENTDSQAPNAVTQPSIGENRDTADIIIIPTGSGEQSQPKRRVKIARVNGEPLARGILPATDAIVTIPQAFGAICLNTSGLELFLKSNALESFFEVFESPDHVKSMSAEIDLPRLLGSSFDEIVRHHPRLKPNVMSSVIVMLARVVFLCRSRAWQNGVGAKLWTESEDGRLRISGGKQSLLGDVADLLPAGLTRDFDEDVVMGEPISLVSGEEPTTSTSATHEVAAKASDPQVPSVSTYINVAAKFLAGFFENNTLCAMFIDAGGIEFILDFATLPSLPYDFNNQQASQEIAKVVHMLVEQKPHLVLPSLINRTLKTLDVLEPLTGHADDSAFFSQFTTNSSTSKGKQHETIAQSVNPVNGTTIIKALVNIHTLCNILYEAFTQPIFTTRTTHTLFSQTNLADMYITLVKKLGRLHRACVWEEILLQNSIPDSLKEATRIKGYGMGSDEADEVFGFISRDRPTTGTGESGPSTTPPAGSGTLSPSPSRATATNGTASNDISGGSAAKLEDTVQFKNVQSIRYLLSQIPSSITPFFQGLGKALVPKRRLESYLRQSAYMVAEALAEATLGQLQYELPKRTPHAKDRYAYWIVILTSISQLMIEGPVERPHPQCLTLVLQAFKNQGGLNATKELLKIFFDEVKQISAAPEQLEQNSDGAGRLASAYGGIKIILTFYTQIITSKYIVESTQTQGMSSDNRNREQPDYFSANQFLVELRMAVLPVVRSVWESDFADRASSSILKCMIEILRTVLEGEHEQGAFKRSDKVPVRSKSQFKPFNVNRDKLETLKAKGIDQSLAREALYRCVNNREAAEEYCRAHTEIPRLSRAPIPSHDLEAEKPSSPARSVHREDSEATLPNTEPLSENGFDTGRTSLPSTASPERESSPIPDTNPEIEMEGDGDDRNTDTTMPPPPPAPESPPLIDLEGGEGMEMSIDNLLSITNLLNPITPNGSGAIPSRDTSTPIPTAVVEAANESEIVTIEDLDEERSAVRRNLIDRCLDVLNVHADIIFELSDLITTAAAKAHDAATMRKEIGETLIQSLISFQAEEDLRQAGKKIASYANLLAIVLQEKEFYDASLDELRANFSQLLGFIKIFPGQTSEDSVPWIGQILLVIEKLLAEDVQPQMIKWTPPTSDEAQSEEHIVDMDEPLVPHEEKIELFKLLVEILPHIGKDESLALSVTRVLVILTRNREISDALSEKKNLQGLFVMMKQLAGSESEKLQSSFMLVLRHMIEDDETIRQIMRTEIVANFETRPSRPTDTTSYIRHMFHLVLRSPTIFVEITNEKLKLQKFDPNQRPQILTLKESAPVNPVTNERTDGLSDVLDILGDSSTRLMEDVKPTTEEETNVEGTAAENSKAPVVKAPIMEHPDGVIHFLLTQLLSFKDVEDKVPEANAKDATKESLPQTPVDVEMTQGVSSPPQEPAQPIETAAEKKAEKPDFQAEQHPIYVYRCFLLQCLTELLASYNRTKIEFINYSRKADPKAMTPSKPKSGVLNYLLNALIPIGILEPNESILYRKKSNTSTWAVATIVALCMRTGEKGSDHRAQPGDEDSEPELLFVRKFVLEHALKAYKDAHTTNEGLQIKYARMLGLADLFNRILLSRTSQSLALRGADSEVNPHRELAKIMFDKGYIAALTASIADLDLNFPGAKRAVKYILKPLKLLTQTAIYLSETSTASTTPGQTDDDDISTASSASDIENVREETPDLFRHSTLGMLEPGREEESSSESSDEDEDMYDDEYDDGMEYEEELERDGDEVISDEEEDADGPGHVEGLPGDVGMNVEVVIDGDEDDDDEASDEDDPEDSDDMDEDEEVEIIDEITGDEGNGSLADGNEEEWQDEDDDREDYHDEDVMDHESSEAHDHPDHSPTVRDLMREMQNAGAALPNLDRQEFRDLEMDIENHVYMEEAVHDDEDDDEDDDDEMDDEDIVYEPDYEDEDADMPDPPWGWDPDDELAVPARGHTHHHHHSRRLQNPWLFPPGERGMIGKVHSQIREMFANLYAVPAYRSHRGSGVPRGTDDGTNPLLQRTGQTGSIGGHSRINRLGPVDPGATMSDWVHAIHGHRHQSEGAVSFINSIVSAVNSGGPGFGTIGGPHGALHFHIGGTGPHAPLPRDIQAVLGLRRPMPEPVRTSREDPMTITALSPTATVTRWQEEARLLFGNAYTEKIQRVVNSLLKVLVPPVMEEERLRKQREAEAAEESRKQKEDAARVAEELRVLKEAAEKEAKEKEEREAADRAAAESEAAVPDGSAAQTGEAPGSGDVDAMEGVESAENEAPAATTNASVAEEESSAPDPSEPSSRVRATFRGREVDITGLGIDLEYLDALPDELREEVLLQQLAEQRSQAQTAGEEPTDISREFLEALPAEIREELLQQEAQDRRRREREENRRRTAANGGAPAARAEEMDPASFFASLDPHLRQAVLLEQDDDVLAQLPPTIAAEARALSGDRPMYRWGELPHPNRVTGRIEREGRAPDPAVKKTPRRQVVQMLDKAGVATLLRLLFVSQQGTSRGNLNEILNNVSQNRVNRAEVVSLLLSILQDGSADVGAVERSFVHLSLRAKQPALQKTPQPLKRTLTNSMTPPLSAEMTPLTVIQQCLFALVYLTELNPHIPSFFLTEHDTASGLRTKSAKKGKGKDNRASRFALNSLLSLLDHKMIMESSSCMEQLSTLLQSITHPLTMLLRKDKDKDKPKEPAQEGEASAEPMETAEDATAPSEAQPQTEDTPMAGTNSATAGGEPEVPEPTRLTETAAAPIAGTSETGGKANETTKSEEDGSSKKQRTLVPPFVPEENLRLVVNILAARECSAKTFRDTLSTINNLSAIPGAKEIFGKELIRQAQDLGESISKDLDELIPQIQSAETGTDIQGMALAKFSPSSSDQAKLLRVLTALDYLFDPKRNGGKTTPTGEDDSAATDGKEDLLTTLYENSTFGPLWVKLSDCLSTIRQRDSMTNVATILLPLVEALMVVCKNTTLKDASSMKNAKEFAVTSPPPESRMENLFFRFTEDHRKILNDLVRHNPRLMSGTFSLLVKNPKVLEFDNKRNYFTRRLHSRGGEARHPQPPLQLSVRRDQVFHDSFRSLHYRTPEEMKYGKLSIRFHGEEGVDAGGVTREWFQVMSRQMFNPDYALFIPVASDRTTFHPNKLSHINEEHLMFFKFIGRVIGKALYEGRALDCHFSRAVYKRILGKPVSIKDMETLDLDYYKSLLWMLENDIADIITETFSIETEEFGVTTIVDLIENGRNIPVTEDNKQEYVQLVVEYRLTGSVKVQLEEFLKGFHDIVPAELIAIFNEQELELLISGLPDIDVDDWKNNTEYHNYQASSPQIQWFWRAVRSFDKEERAKLLQFVTGTSKVPLNGFKELEGMNGFSRFNIHRDYGNKDRLPSSHTCFNQLDLPEYESYEALRQQVYTAMTAGSEYFGFA
ncbi:hypothetical protein MMC30_007874 [Trapelia coarctata]|nr:hypothetical protein [Trapelia coarctata]